jgi:hypothetical protein
VNLDTKRGNVLLLEFASQMSLDESSLEEVSMSLLVAEWSSKATTSFAQPQQWCEDHLTLPVPPSPTKTSLKVGTF